MLIPLPPQNSIVSFHKPNEKSDLKGKVFCLGYYKAGTLFIGQVLKF
tara:strand:- start:22 stop:162 length:141 start_codon:yes stop_codon:yes gene_type:complete